MKIWVSRHGQTNYNKARLMQGRIDEPLNETGIGQAKEVRRTLGDIRFDAVYASPLKRAVKTAAIIGDVDESEIIIDPRIIEVDFGKYEKAHYHRLGVKMTLFWALPELFKAPASVETIKEMTDRTSSFLKELETKEYENVLVVCHGGIMRAVCGYLEDRKNGIMWRPKPTNCEVRVYESVPLGDGRFKHSRIS